MSDPFDSRDAAILVQLAEAATRDFASGPVLPSGWSLARSFVSDPWAGASGQGLIALGQLPSDPDTPVAVLALGARWGGMLATLLTPQTGQINTLPGVLPGNGSLTIGVNGAYLAVRSKMWAALAGAGSRPLIVTGLYLGAPMAQVAGIDLRPGNKGPDGNPAPVTVMACYAFSSPAPGDSSTASDLARVVPQAWTFSRQHLGEIIDFFPVSRPAAAVEAGQQVVLPASISEPIDDPWMERAASAYITSLGETPPPGPPVQPASINPIPEGFSAGRAANLARMLSLPYLMRQHPGTGSPLNFSPYVYQEDIKLGGRTLATVMTWNTEAVLCFRGSVDWFEWGQYTCNCNLVRPPFPAPSTALVHAGALAMYQDKGATPDLPTVKEQMSALLPRLVASHPDLYFAGHGSGAAVAVLAAMDQLAAGTISKAPGFYTYGELMTGNSDFVTKAREQLTQGYFPLARPGDFMPQSTLFQGYSPIAERLRLSGVPVDDEPTNHALTGYMELLSPYSSGSARLARPLVLELGRSATGSPTLV